ncbi:hypothetical protein [uncultured Modestobacter sp.]|uniref:hypothetical protein n=1 Tax=uncultured Modestobacter sp. TaxID=380048 RepID=UPI0026308662|nr:hypothetical protein [uncultured Modestobacter sp.]
MTNHQEEPRPEDRASDGPRLKGKRALLVVASAVLGAAVVVALVWIILYNAAS